MTDGARWTPEHLTDKTGRGIHTSQRREQVQPIADDLMRIYRETAAHLAEMGKLPGDFPMQDKYRAKRTSAPLKSAAQHLQAALADLVTFDARYAAQYEELPAKREARALAKAQAKQNKAITAPQTSPPTSTQAAPGSAPAVREAAQGTGFEAVFGDIRRSA